MSTEQSSKLAPGGVAATLHISARPANRRRYGRWRTVSLVSVYVLMVAHVVHWRLAGRTLAPLELNEVLYTLELGIVTAGFVFMAVALLATLLFGRFFCGWGCHILALQDLSAGLLGRLGVRPKPVRSRALLLVPPSAMVYMFAWPHVQRLIEGRSLPPLRVLGDDDGWASFVTENFWRNLPGPGMAIATFLVVGGAIVLALGSRSFCRAVCPYGAIFGLADRLAPGRIVARGDCTSCGLCTARCSSHVRVHEELLEFGRVVDPACLKDMDCVEACPSGAIGFGLARPAGLLSWSHRARALRPRFDWTLQEDVLAGIAILGTTLALRGLLGLVPFLLALALSVLTAHLVVMLVHLRRRADVRFQRRQLRRGGRTTVAGRVVATLAVAWISLVAAAGALRMHEHAGARLCAALDAARPSIPPDDSEIARTIAALERAERWLPTTDRAINEPLARLVQERGRRAASAGRIDAAIADLQDAHRRVPDAVRIRFDLARALAAAGRHVEALEHLLVVAHARPDDPSVAVASGLSLAAVGRLDEALAALQHAVALRPDDADALAALSRLEDETAPARTIKPAR